MLWFYLLPLRTKYKLASSLVKNRGGKVDSFILKSNKSFSFDISWSFAWRTGVRIPEIELCHQLCFDWRGWICSHKRCGVRSIIEPIRNDRLKSSLTKLFYRSARHQRRCKSTSQNKKEYSQLVFVSSFGKLAYRSKFSEEIYFEYFLNPKVWSILFMLVIV